MSDVITEHNLFRPSKSKTETKADITNETARAIIAAEEQNREAKSARLRQARLESEAAAPPPAPAKRAPRKTTKRGTAPAR